MVCPASLRSVGKQIEQVFTFRPNYNFEINSPLIRPQLKKIFDGKKKV